MIQKASRFLVAVGFASLSLVALVTVGERFGASQAPSQDPPLLEKIQALGTLHTVSYRYNDIHDFQTSKKPVFWLAGVPGAADVVSAATQNTATISFSGTVEAGVDLSRARVSQNKELVTIYVPKPEMYAPNVSAKVHEFHRGWFWGDIDLTDAAISDEKNRIHDCSLREGILQAAKQNTVTRLVALTHSLTSKPVSIVFT